MTDRAGGDGSRRPTKAERKEQSRRERDEIQRQMATRSRNRKLGIAAVALAAAIVVVVVFVVQPGSESNADGLPTPEQLLDQAFTAASVAGCDEVQTTGPYGGVDDPTSPDHTDQVHIGGDDRFPEMPPLDSYPSIPPTSGPHANIPPGPMPAGFYSSPPDLARVLHSLEHGASAIWYSPDAPQAQVDELDAFFGQEDEVGQDRVIVAPYDYEGAGGQLPEGVMMAPTAWHRLQTCTQVSLPVAFDFTSQFSAPPFGDRQYAGEAPEPGAAL